MNLTTPILLVPLDAGKLHYLLAKHPGSAGLKALVHIPTHGDRSITFMPIT